MATNFFYFISFLPSLEPKGPAPFKTYAEFLECASSHLSVQEMQILSRVTLCPDAEAAENDEGGVLYRWAGFETYLRDFLLEARGRKLKKDVNSYRRENLDVYPGVIHRLEEIVGNTDIAERERMLDLLRWQQLDNLAAGHEFDFSAVLIYALRLCILIRHHSVYEKNDGSVMTKILESAVDAAIAVRVNEHAAQ